VNVLRFLLSKEMTLEGLFKVAGRECPQQSLDARDDVLAARGT
jgi:hypothetical protein